MDKYFARASLPEVGEVLWVKPAYGGFSKDFVFSKPRKATVILVHPAHLWFTVKYDNGIRESFKVPRLQFEHGGPSRGEI